MFRKFFCAFVLVTSVSILAACTTIPQSDPQPRLEVTWLGGPTVIFEFNGLRILTDPTFGDGAEAFTMGDPNEMFDLSVGPNIKYHKRLTPFPGIDSSSIDLVILSHAHEDHFDQKAQAKLSPTVSMILPIADTEKVKAMGFENMDSLRRGDKRTLKAGPGQVTITAITAHHSENSDIDKILGVGNGYWIKFSQGDWHRTVYWTGDSFPTDDVVEAVTRFGEVDILIPHLGGVGTTGPLGLISMDADNVVALVKKISPRKVLPIHHSTYELYLEPISKLAAESEGKSFALDLISVGTTVVYD